MGVDQTLTEAGVELDEFNKPSGNPTKRLFARLVSNMRSIETAWNDDRRMLADQNAVLLGSLERANERIRVLENKLQGYQVKAETRRLDLAEADSKRLLEAATSVD